MVKFKNIRAIWKDTKTRSIALVLAFLLCFSSLSAISSNAYTVRINIDGLINKITTLSMNAHNILTQANVQLVAGDVVDASDFQPGVDGTQINVYKGYNVTIQDEDGKEIEAIGNNTVAETLENNNIKLSADDELNYCREDKVSEGMKIIIYRAFPIQLEVDGEKVPLNVAKGTVGEALAKAQIKIGTEDVVNVSLDEMVTTNTSITVTRTIYKDRTETVAIPFKTEIKQSPEMTAGKSKIETQGVEGSKTITYKDKYVGGKLVESVEVSSTVTKEPITQVKIVSTQKINATNTTGLVLANGVKTISTLQPPVDLELDGLTPTKYKKVITGTASAYSCGTHTATGKRVQPGYVAVNPKQIPYGSKLWIVSNDGKYVYGYASAEDTGGFVKWTGSRATVCDLYFTSEADCIKFGRRGVTIYVLE
jgi:uncharacterized protein YabE (DUF348 family)/3D (Asp-Asp-Asp) domain-containing protein